MHRQSRAGYIDYYNLLTELDPTRIKHLTKKWLNQYAQAKVLEALEREFSKVDILMFDEDRSSDYTEQGKFYYETEVKLKYE